MPSTLRLAAATSLLLALFACSGLNPLETDKEDAGIELKVVDCTYDETTMLAKASFELTSEKEYDTILVNGELSDESGVVISTTSTSVSGVEPGKTYRNEMVFGSTEKPQGEISCAVDFEFANAGFGG